MTKEERAAKYRKKHFGECSIANCGMKMFIVAYRNNDDIDVVFQDGTIAYNQQYKDFINGDIHNANIGLGLPIHNQIGEMFANKKEQSFIVMQYRKYSDVDVIFEDGYISRNKSMGNIKRGAIENPNFVKKYIGETQKARNGQMMTIIEFINASNITVEFEDGTIVKGKRYRAFQKGEIGNPNCMQPKLASTNELGLLFYLEKYGFMKAPKKSLKNVGMGNFELDLYHPTLKIGIEYDGYRHTNKKDFRKNLACKDAGIYLIRIREPHLPKLNDGLSKNFYLESDRQLSQNLNSVFVDVCLFLNSKFNFNIDISVIDFEKDKDEIYKKINSIYLVKRTGEVGYNGQGFRMTITAYRNYNDIDVVFDDGSVVMHRTYDNFKHGGIKHPYLTKIALERIGKSSISSKGEKMTIIAYRNGKDIDVQFEDGTIVKNKNYREFIKGYIENPNQRESFKNSKIGESVIANNGQKMTIIAYHDCNNVDIKFEDGTIVKNKRYRSFKSGGIENPNFKDRRIGETKLSVCGQVMTIIAYRGATDIDVQFEDGTIVIGKAYGNFKNGRIGNPNAIKKTQKQSKIGKTKMSKTGKLITIIAEYPNKRIDVQFEDGTIIKNKGCDSFYKGTIKHPDEITQVVIPDFIGETRIANNGQKMTIIACKNKEKIDVQFEDGTIVYNTKYSSFLNGTTKNPTLFNRVGELGTALTGETIKIIEYYGCENITVLFPDGTTLKKQKYSKFKHNQIRNPNYVKPSHIGETNMSNSGQKMTIIAYRNHEDIDIQLENGEILYKKRYDAFKNGQIRTFKSRVGETVIAKNGQKITIVAYRSAIDLDVQFEDGVIVTHRTYYQFENRLIENPNKTMRQIKTQNNHLSHIGEVRADAHGNMATIIAFRGSHDFDIQFADNLIKKCTSYTDFCDGKFAHPNAYAMKRVGENKKATNGQMMTICVYRSSADIDVKFEDGTVVKNKEYKMFKKGQIRNPNLIQNVQKNNT